jgi:hypothetical protein
MITHVLGITFLTFAYMLSPSLGIEPIVCVMSDCFHVHAILPWSLFDYYKVFQFVEYWISQ